MDAVWTGQLDKYLFSNQNTVGAAGISFGYGPATGNYKLMISNGTNYVVNVVTTVSPTLNAVDSIHLWGDGSHAYLQVNTGSVYDLGALTWNGSNPLYELTLGSRLGIFYPVIFSRFKIEGQCDYTTRNAYGTVLPDMSGNANHATLINPEYLQYPALSDGTDDVIELGIINPPNLAHNAALYSLDALSITNVPITYAALITGVHDVGIETNSYYQVEEIYHVQ